MKIGLKKRTLWIARDPISGDLSGSILLSSKKPIFTETTENFIGGWKSDEPVAFSIWFCSREFTKATGVSLNPGEGPYRAEINVRFLD